MIRRPILIILIYLLRKPLFVIILAPKKMTSGKILYVLGEIRMIILGGCGNAADGRDVTG